MLGAQNASDALRLEDQLDLRGDGFGFCHATMVAAESWSRIGSTPDTHPDSW
jgi:hypothetical protein